MYEIRDTEREMKPKKQKPSCDRMRDHPTYNEGSSVVFMVFVVKEDVDNGGHEGIQEGEDCNGDKELCRR